MGRYTISRRIPTAPANVFRAFTDPVLVADWMAASEVRDATGSLGTAGTRYTLVIRGPWRFRTRVVRAEPGRVHETRHEGPLGSSARMIATLTPVIGASATDLELLTEYVVPLGPLGRWIDRRWLASGPRTQANREIDRLVELVVGEGIAAEPTT